jgi:hypothetical protein
MDILEGIRELIATGKHDESAREIFTFEYVLFWTSDKFPCTPHELVTAVIAVLIRASYLKLVFRFSFAKIG